MHLSKLEKPNRIDHDNWKIIENHENRLDRDLKARDYSAAISSSKCLAETTARNVCELEDIPLGQKVSFEKVVHEAQSALGRQPGKDLASDKHSRTIAQSAVQIVKSINSLRSEYGPDHRGPGSIMPLEEHAEVAATASILWTRWILNRLDQKELGRHSQLIADLKQRIWRQGDLTDRFNCVDWDGSEDSELEALGTAVGRRWAGKTYNVRDEGILPAIKEPGQWKTPYRIGLAKGIAVNLAGGISFGPNTEQAEDFHEIYSQLEKEKYHKEVKILVGEASLSGRADTTELVPWFKQLDIDISTNN